MRRDDDLVGAERAQRVLDRLQRIRLADLAARRDSRFAQLCEARIDALLRLRARRILVRGQVLERRGLRRRNDEDVRLPPGRLLRDHLSQRAAADGLVRDDEDPQLVLRMRQRWRDGRRTLVAAADECEIAGDQRQDDEHREPDPGVDHRPDHDQREVADREQQEAKRLCLTAERVPHGARGRTRSCRRRSTSRRRSASRSRQARRRSAPAARSVRGRHGSS